MSRVYPTVASIRNKAFLARINDDDGEKMVDNNPCPIKLTVWKKSSMTFQGTDGFTVFDGHGKLVFRVDNYSRSNSCSEGGVILMDGAGNALMTLKPQMWSMQCQWDAYRGESYGFRPSRSSGHNNSLTKLRVFSMRRGSRHLLRSSKAVAEVFLTQGDHPGCRALSNRAPDFTVDGSFKRRNCCIRNSSGEVVARINRKRVMNGGVVLSSDVFSMVIKPGFDAEMVMGFVIVLDRICCKSFGPVMCS